MPNLDFALWRNLNELFENDMVATMTSCSKLRVVELAIDLFQVCVIKVFGPEYRSAL
jgi:hypothetical protein